MEMHLATERSIAAANRSCLDCTLLSGDVSRRCSMRTHNLGWGCLEQHDFGGGVQMRRAAPTGGLAIVFPGHHSTVRFCGRDLGEDEMVMLRGDRADVATFGPGVLNWIAMDPTAVEANIPAHWIPHGVTTLRSAGLDRLRASCDRVFAPDRARRSKSGGSVRADVAAALASVLRFGRPESTDDAAGLHYEITRRAESYMWDRSADPLMLQDIARGAQCSTRQLLYAFSVVYGVGPVRYFKLLRLNEVRRKLCLSPQTSITEVATEFGFWHHGHFGSAYRELFGETPTATRLRSMPFVQPG